MNSKAASDLPVLIFLGSAAILVIGICTGSFSLRAKRTALRVSALLVFFAITTAILWPIFAGSVSPR